MLNIFTLANGRFFQDEIVPLQALAKFQAKLALSARGMCAGSS